MEKRLLTHPAHQNEHFGAQGELFSIPIQLKHDTSPRVVSIPEFENIFGVTYRRFLTFSSTRQLEEIIRNCPYLLKLESLMGLHAELDALYEPQLSAGFIANLFIKWVNPLFEYGLFAAVDLPERSFIGEYTGRVRQVDRASPKLNAYCFHYPTRFWSWNYFLIDASREGNLLRFVNHSEQPNVQPLWLLKRGILHLIFIANRFIPTGMELTFDYGPDYWIHRKKVSVPPTS